MELIRHWLGDDVHLGTDVLSGFPGESEEAFARTLTLVRELGFGRLHVFPYSIREGTAAASMSGQVPRQAAEARCREGIALGEKLLDAYARRWEGRVVDLLVEETREGKILGFSRHYLRVVASGEADPAAELAVLVDSSKNGELSGSIYCVSS